MFCRLRVGIVLFQKRKDLPDPKYHGVVQEYIPNVSCLHVSLNAFSVRLVTEMSVCFFSFFYGEALAH